jgi:hypothetical protein
MKKQFKMFTMLALLAGTSPVAFAGTSFDCMLDGVEYKLKTSKTKMSICQRGKIGKCEHHKNLVKSTKNDNGELIATSKDGIDTRLSPTDVPGVYYLAWKANDWKNPQDKIYVCQLR